MKPYQQIPIHECGEPLLPIPIAPKSTPCSPAPHSPLPTPHSPLSTLHSPQGFALEHPHPYVKLGAPYGDKSPYFVRQGVLERLQQAQNFLHQQKPGWRIQIFDAYRPIAVQQFMVDYTFQTLLTERSLTVDRLTETEQASLWEEVYQFWAVPSPDPATPPPHSTGAAIDITLVNETGETVDMGSAIDELSPRSYPNHFADISVWKIQNPGMTEAQADRFHQNRQLLRQAMTSAGFLQHPNEWWHFSWGDQLWAWQMAQAHPGRSGIARYGGI
ncbi:M15 family metallopeptidase [Leptolyngbya ohadii]|uniref:M15 family metallopeptidase n=1 Tax=Leptolyngbya ohadii TaxID=1962290 RepID=UPI000B59E46E